MRCSRVIIIGVVDTTCTTATAQKDASFVVDNGCRSQCCTCITTDWSRTVTAATIGAIIIFLIARSSFGEVFQARAGPFINKMTEGFQKDAFQYLLTLRLVPVFPFWVVNIVPALLNMRLLPYGIGTFFGIIPGTFAFTYLGAGLDSVIAEQEKSNPGCVDAGTCTIDPKALVTTDLLLALAALAALSFLPFVLKKVAPGKKSTEEPVTNGKES